MTFLATRTPVTLVLGVEHSRLMTALGAGLQSAFRALFASLPDNRVRVDVVDGAEGPVRSWIPAATRYEISEPVRPSDLATYQPAWIRTAVKSARRPEIRLRELFVRATGRVEHLRTVRKAQGPVLVALFGTETDLRTPIPEQTVRASARRAHALDARLRGAFFVEHLVGSYPPAIGPELMPRYPDDDRVTIEAATERLHDATRWTLVELQRLL